MTDRLGLARAHPARRHDYWTGGKDNFAKDRDSGDLFAEHFPVQRAAQENRHFVRRALAVMLDAGVEQILDIGVGMPTYLGNTHELAQAIHRPTRVVYVDVDPVVLVYGRGLLAAAPDAGKIAIAQGDLLQPSSILAAAETRETLNLSKPVGLFLVAVLELIPDTERLRQAVTELVAALPPGSWLAITHLSADLLPAGLVDQFEKINDEAGIPMYLRDLVEIGGFFDGLDVAEPGVVPIHQWRADPTPRPDHLEDAPIGWYGGLARKGCGPAPDSGSSG